MIYNYIQQTLKYTVTHGVLHFILNDSVKQSFSLCQESNVIILDEQKNSQKKCINLIIASKLKTDYIIYVKLIKITIGYLNKYMYSITFYI